MVRGSGGGCREFNINMRMQRCKCEVAMNAVYGNAARLMFRRTSEKTRCPGGQKCGVCQRMPEVCQYSTVWTVGARGAGNAAEVPRLLHVDEEVALEDVLPFLVLLGLFVRFVLLKPE
jgi:hypothetical protein